MRIMRGRTIGAMLFSAFLFGFAPSATAAPILYTFEQFGAVLQTPLLSVAPDSGPSSFLASFTSAPAATGFLVAPFQANGLFSGNSLFEPLGSLGNTLTVTVNQAIFSISLVFATNGPGTLNFGSPVGSTSVTSTSQGGGNGFPGGTLTFSSATPFLTFGLNAGASPEFAIDNLSLDLAPTAVPEPSTLILCGVGLVAGLRRVRRSQRRA